MSQPSPFAFLLAAAALTGCASTEVGTKLGKAELTARAQIVKADTLSQMSFWAKQTDLYPDDPVAAAEFVNALRRGHQPDRAVEAGALALQRMADDKELRRAYAHALLALGRGAESVLILSELVQEDSQDWRARDALGVALDQAGRPVQARQAYQAALALVPDSVGVMTNLGVSYLLTGDAAKAEEVLRKAVELPGASAETRQNLALAIGLQGRFGEAEDIQRVDLAPEQVASNVSFMRNLLSDGRRWEDLTRAQ